MAERLGLALLNHLDHARLGIAQDVQHIFEEAEECLNTSPDFPELCQWDSHYVFVYGTLKHGFSRTRSMDESDIVGVGYTKNHFEMYRVDKEWTFPVILLDSTSKRKAAIYGELYKVPTSVMRDLDYIENNTYQYKRLKIPVDVIVDKSGTVKQYYAWCYIGMKAYWEKRKEALVPCDILTSSQDKKFTYYNFMKKYVTEAQA